LVEIIDYIEQRNAAAAQSHYSPTLSKSFGEPGMLI